VVEGAEEAEEAVERPFGPAPAWGRRSEAGRLFVGPRAQDEAAQGVGAARRVVALLWRKEWVVELVVGRREERFPPGAPCPRVGRRRYRS